MAMAKSENRIASIDMPVTAIYRFFFKDRQAEADVSNLCEAPGDLLQKAGLLKDDRLICQLIALKFFGHEPRTEIEIHPYEEGNQ